MALVEKLKVIESHANREAITLIKAKRTDSSEGINGKTGRKSELWLHTLSSLDSSVYSSNQDSGKLTDKQSVFKVLYSCEQIKHFFLSIS